MKRLMFLFVAAALVLSGCASVIHGTSQEIKFDSSPSGAKVYLDGNLVGTTPFSMKLKKTKYKSFRIELEGYETIQRDMTTEYDLLALLNVFWDLSTTDLITGAAFKYDENSYFVELKKK